MMIATRDGVKLAHRDLGAGSDPIILIHGWACDYSFLLPQLKHLSQSYRVLAVDVCGHGESDEPEREYKVAEFADDIRWLSASLKRHRRLSWANSMGGEVALELAAYHPEAVSAICLIDSVLFPSGSFTARMRQVQSALAGLNYLDTLIQVALSLFLEADDPLIREQILTKMGRVRRHVALLIMPHHSVLYLSLGGEH